MAKKLKKHSYVIDTPTRRPVMEFGPYTSEEHPPVDWESDGDGSMSDYVLIDVDGHANDFEVGYYNFDRKDWNLRNGDRYQKEIDIKRMRWAMLPLAKYGKK